MNNFLITVVTITFNNHSELMDTVESLKGIKGIQHLVINGGSSEETLKFLSTYAGKSVSEKDSGISDAFNKGILYADGDAIVFLNSGDKLIEKSYYERAAAILVEHNDIDYVHADIEFIDMIAGKLVLKAQGPLPKMPFTHPSIVTRKQVFERIGGFDTKYRSAMDLDWAYRLNHFGAKGHYIPEPVVEMDGRGISSAKPMLGFQEKFGIIRQWHGYHWKEMLILIYWYLKLKFRLLLEKLGLQNVISGYRKKKYLYSK